MYLILGAGLAGLSAAYHLNSAGCHNYAIYEREASPGGLCRSESADGFTFDYTGHFLHMTDPALKDLVSQLLDSKISYVTRNSWIFSHGIYTRYPFQTNTYGLPVKVIKEIILGYIQARYENVEIPRQPVDGNGLPEVKRSFERWIYKSSGPGIAKHFMIPYNDKLLGVHPRFITAEWMGRFMPPVSMESVIEGALTNKTPSVGYNATFQYPIKGGINSLVKVLAKHVGSIHLACEAIMIDPQKRIVQFSDGSSIHYHALVSTIPLPEIVARLQSVPENIFTAASKLRCSSIFAVNLGLRCDRTEGRHWVYIPDRRFRFHRVGCYSNVATSMAPTGSAAVWVEMTYNAHRPIDRKAMRQEAIAGLKAMGILRSSREIAVEWLLDIPYAYVTLDAYHYQATRTIHQYLERHKIYCIGRFGRWEYSSMEDAISQGRDIAKQLVGNKMGQTN